MILKGTHRIEGVSQEAVFDALSDPAVLARTLPGCRELVERGEGVYEVSIYAGVGSIRGIYSGRVSIGERHRPEHYEAKLEASGAPGSVTAALRAQLSNGGSGTEVAYEMDAKIAGRIAGVGQRVVSGVSRKNAATFFRALEDELTGRTPVPMTGTTPSGEGPTAEPTSPGAGQATSEVSTGQPAAAPRTYSGRAPAPFDSRAFFSGLAAGVLLSLLLRRWRR